MKDFNKLLNLTSNKGALIPDNLFIKIAYFKKEKKNF